MYNVLIVDVSSYKDSVAGLFREFGYNVEVSESAFDAMSKLKIYDFDLIVSEVDLPGNNAFELYNYIKSYYPYIPMMMITEKEIDNFFERIFQEGIGNVLCKPLSKEEVANLSFKLITKKNVFGLKNYMEDIQEIKKMRITSSDKIQIYINKIFAQIESWNCKIENKIILKLVLNEVILNALYHSHGYKKQKEERKQIKLKKDEYVDIFLAKSSKGYGISINDYRGKLSKMMILENLNNAIKQSQLILRAFETGEEISDKISESGRGLDLLRKIAKDYYFIIKKNIRTEVILLFTDMENKNKTSGTSLKIIEDN
ncbi:MAG: response regulator [Spirochaetes bacterium]|nr:response regulator [Spirochaetota bacterium]